jgi:uncharacterized protein YqgV (UPF0045/DUF77 family)
MSNPGMEKLGQLLQNNPALQKAALSGMTQAVTKAIQEQGLSNQIDPEAMVALGKIAASPIGDGSPVADDYVARAVSSVLAVVKIRVADLADNLDRLSQLQKTVNIQLDSLHLPADSLQKIRNIGTPGL